MLHRLHIRKSSQGSGIDQPVSVEPSASGQPKLPKPGRRVSGGHRLSSFPKLAMKSMLAPPDVPKLAVDRDNESLPQEMIPVLTLLASHGSRNYIEGYFMVLSELNNEGEPIPERRWTEVYGTLQGTIITMWDAAQLDAGKYETSFINVTDGYMRSVEALGPELQNVIVLSTTMKNRFLLQFGTKKLFNEWTAALRLANFERTSLQEAYTGALLSSKGTQLSGVRALLAESHARTEFWCNVRFGVGMPWKRVWVAIFPNSTIKSKKERNNRNGFGKVVLYNDPKDTKKKRPLATIHRVFTAFAVFPEKSVLVNVSSLCKLECFVEFDGDDEMRESSIFLMPEQHPGIQGFETLIRTLIPLYDVFQLYGRPKRLNADKSDIKSLLFGMPSLPRAYYLDVIDVFMLATLPDATQWNSNDWNSRIKELIARKMAVGFKGTGDIHKSRSGTSTPSAHTPLSRSPRLDSPSTMPPPPGDGSGGDRKRAVSDPHGVPRLFASNSQDSLDTTNPYNKHAPSTPSPLQHSRPAPKAPMQKNSRSNLAGDASTGSSNSSNNNLSANPFGRELDGFNRSNNTNNKSDTSIHADLTQGGINGYAGNGIAVSTPNASSNNLAVPGVAPRGPRMPPQASAHQRVKSEGQTVETGLLSPDLGDMRNGFSTNPHAAYSNDNGAANSPRAQPPMDAVNKRISALTVESQDSFTSAAGNAGDAAIGENIFDPKHRPAHQSYAQYSEYMRQYLKNVPANGAAAGAAGAGAASVGAQPHSSAGKPQPGPGAGGHQGVIATAVEEDSTDSEQEDYPQKSFRPHTPEAGGSSTRLLSTPIRTPVVKEGHSPAGSANSALKSDPSPPPTALNAPRIPAYPNAPGSPGGAERSQDSLHIPKAPHASEGGQRRPSGPRDFPSSPHRVPAAIAPPGPGYEGTTAQAPQVNPFARPPHHQQPPPPQQQQQYPPQNPYTQHQPYQQPHQQPNRYAQGPPPPGAGGMPGARASPAQNGYPANYGIPASMQPVPQGAGPNQFAKAPYGAPYGGPPHNAAFGPDGGMPPNRYHAGPQPGGPHPGAQYRGPLPNGMPATGMATSAGPRPMPAQGYGMRPAGPQPQFPNGGPVDPNGGAPKSYNDARQQQLKSMRAQAMGDGSFGI